MEFIAAGELLGETARMRILTLKGAPHLPDGEYSFVDCYCTDLDCDCRKTMIQVYHQQRHVSTIHYGWEPIAFYQKWYGSSKIDCITTEEMKGPSIDTFSPNLVRPQAMLAFFRSILDERYQAVIKSNYNFFKQVLIKSGKK